MVSEEYLTVKFDSNVVGRRGRDLLILQLPRLGAERRFAESSATSIIKNLRVASSRPTYPPSARSALRASLNSEASRSEGAE